MNHSSNSERLDICSVTSSKSETFSQDFASDIDHEIELKIQTSIDAFDKYLNIFDENLFKLSETSDDVTHIPLIPNFSLVESIIEEDSNFKSFQNRDINRFLLVRENDNKHFHRIKKACTLSKFGSITCMIQDRFNAYGTSSGSIILEESVRKVSYLSMPSELLHQSPVICLDLSMCKKLLLSVHANGIIILWNILSESIVTIFDEIKKSSKYIHHARFGMNDKSIFFTDSLACGYFLEYKNTLYQKYNLLLIHSSKITTLTLMEPLKISEECTPILNSIPHIIAQSNMNNVFIASCRPEWAIHYNLKSAADSYNPITLAWQITKYNSMKNQVHTKLACGFHRMISIITVTISSTGSIHCFESKRCSNLSESLSICWLNSSYLANININEILEVINSETALLSEEMDLREFRLNYNFSMKMSRFHNSLCGDTILWLPSSLSLNSSVYFGRGKLFILGKDALISFRLKDFKSRTDDYLQNYDHLGCLRMLKEYFCRNLKCGESQASNMNDLQKAINQCLVSQLNYHKNIETIITGPLATRLMYHFHKDAFDVMIPLFMECKLIASLLDHFVDFYTNKPYKIDAFVDSLYQHISIKRIKFLPDDVFHLLMNSFLRRNKVSELEIVFLHTDLATFDLKNIISLCWKFNMFMAVFHIHNNYFSDYTSALTELIGRLNNAMNAETNIVDFHTKIGDCVLLNISTLLYNDTDLSVNGPFQKIIKFLVASSTIAKTQHADKHNLKTLLRYNTKAFLDALSLAFDFQLTRNLDDHGMKTITSCIESLTEVLVQYFVQDRTFSTDVIIQFYIFLARQIALVKHKLIVHKTMLQQIIDSLSDDNPVENSRIEECEQAIISILNSPHKKYVDLISLQLSAEKRNLFGICEHLYRTSFEYEKLIRLYYHSDEKDGIYHKFMALARDSSGSAENMETLKKAVFSCHELLASINPCMFIDNVVELFPTILQHSLLNMMDSINTFRLLTEVFNRGSTNENTDSICSDLAFQELFVELMCTFQPENVVTFLKELSTYHSDRILSILGKFNLLDAQSIVYEKINDFVSANSLRLSSLEKKAQEYSEILKTKREQDCKSLKTFSNCVSDMIEFLGKAYNQISLEEITGSWFRVIDIVVDLADTLKEQFGNKQESNECESIEMVSHLIADLINKIVRYVPAVKVLKRITQQPSIKEYSIGEVHRMLMSMVETHNYDILFYKSTINIISSEMLKKIQRINLASTIGNNIKQFNCILCHQPLIGYKNLVPHSVSNQGSLNNSSTSSAKDFHLYKCGHSIHLRCISRYHPNYGMNSLCPRCHNPSTFSTYIKKPIPAANSASLQPKQLMEIDRICYNLKENHLNNFGKEPFYNSSEYLLE